MRTGMHMTIQDYFRRSGIKNAFATHVGGKDDSGKKISNAFSQTLALAQSAAESQPRHQGLRIQDYVARPVQTVSSIHSSLMETKTALPPSLPTESSLNIVENKKSTAVKDQGQGQTTSQNEKEIILKSIDDAAKRYQLSPSLIRAVVKAESGYQVRALSPAGAQGLMQLMPATAKELGVQNPYDISQNIDGGARYLRRMLDMFDGDIKTALSAYNAGPGTVRRYNGNVPYSETRQYVDRVMRFSRQFS